MEGFPLVSICINTAADRAADNSKGSYRNNLQLFLIHIGTAVEQFLYKGVVSLTTADARKFRWNSSNRKSRLPKNWNSLRHKVLLRDNRRCQLRYLGCWETATDVDHIENNDDHSMSNLHSACSYCHRKKSSREGTTARRNKANLRYRPKERHPGTA